MMNATDYEKLFNDAVELINWTRKNDPDNAEKETIFDDFTTEAGWQPWKEEYTEAEDGDPITEEEGKNIEKEIRKVFEAAWNSLNYEEYAIIEETLEIMPSDLRMKHLPDYLAAEEIVKRADFPCVMLPEEVKGEYKTENEAMTAFKKMIPYSRKEGSAVRFIWAQFHHVDKVRVYWDDLGVRNVESIESIANNACDYGEKIVMVKNKNGEMIDYDAAVQLMDDDIREDLSMELAPCTEQEFMDEYAKRHEQKYGEGFIPYVGGAW